MECGEAFVGFSGLGAGWGFTTGDDWLPVKRCDVRCSSGNMRALIRTCVRKEDNSAKISSLRDLLNFIVSSQFLAIRSWEKLDSSPWHGGNKILAMIRYWEWKVLMHCHTAMIWSSLRAVYSIFTSKTHRKLMISWWRAVCFIIMETMWNTGMWNSWSHINENLSSGQLPVKA